MAPLHLSQYKQAWANPFFRRLCLGLLLLPAVVWQASLLTLACLRSRTTTDFDAFWQAATRLAASHTPYDAVHLASGVPLHPAFVYPPLYVYPPLLAWLIQPLTFQPLLWARIEWMIFEGLLELALIGLLWRLLGLRKDEHKALVALAILSSSLFQTETVIGQLNLAMTVLLALTLVAWQSHSRWGALALGASIALKLYTAPLLLPVLMRRAWVYLTIVVAILVASALVAPALFWEYATKVLPLTDRATDLSRVTSLAGDLERSRLVSYSFGTLLSLGVALLVVLVSYWTIRRLPSSPEVRKLELLVMIAAIPLLLPTLEYFHLVVLTLPVFLVGQIAYRRRAWLPLGVLTTSGFLLSYHLDWTQLLGSSTLAAQITAVAGGICAAFIFVAIITLTWQTKPNARAGEPLSS